MNDEDFQSLYNSLIEQRRFEEAIELLFNRWPAAQAILELQKRLGFRLSHEQQQLEGLNQLKKIVAHRLSIITSIGDERPSKEVLGIMVSLALYLSLQVPDKVFEEALKFAKA